MKKAIIFTLMCVFIATLSFAQTWEDYIESVDGSTVVVKEFWDMGEGEPSTLINAIELDSLAPADRVYQLKTNGWYPMSRQYTTPADRAVVIVGPDDTPLIQADGETNPPLITGYTDGNDTNTGLFGYQNDLTIKNAMVLGCADDGSYAWAPISARAPGNTTTLDNVLMETTKWVFVQSNDHADNDLIVMNSYFVNMSGQACRRNGGVYDNVSNPTDTMWVENTTHVMAQGMIYKFRNFPLTKAFFNHNTFVNCSGQLFATMGYQNEWSVTNNLFVNSHIQPYMPGLDYGETDQDSLPMGIINVDTLPSYTDEFEGLTEAGRKILVDRNGLYWADALDAIVPGVNDLAANDYTEWVTQMIRMNDRTAAMFADDDNYPLLTNGTWIEGGDPVFTDPADLMTDAVDDLVEYTINIMDDDATNTLPWWRTADNPAATNLIYPDWPIPVDLSYSNEQYVSAGYNGLPLGDLNWFPTAKQTWLAQKPAEHAAIQAALDTGTPLGTSVEKSSKTPARFSLEQNYPNPFNPTTTIKYSVPNSGNVTLKVFDLLGKEVASLVDGYKHANQSYQVQFDGAELASGMYVYTLTAGDYQVSRKMLLMK